MAIASGLGVAISGATGLVGGLINKIGARKREKRQIAHNKDLADYQYDKQMEMWNAQNEYNKPANQMELYKEAGLNPHLIYGTGSQAASGSAGDQPAYQASQVESPKIEGIPEAYAQQQSLGIKQGQLGLSQMSVKSQIIQRKFQNDLISEKIASEGVNRANSMFKLNKDRMFLNAEYNRLELENEKRTLENNLATGA